MATTTASSNSRRRPCITHAEGRMGLMEGVSRWLLCAGTKEYQEFTCGSFVLCVLVLVLLVHILYNAWERGNKLVYLQYKCVCVCLAFHTVCEVSCGAIMLSNRSRRHSLREKGAAFHCTFKLHTLYCSILFH